MLAIKSLLYCNATTVGEHLLTYLPRIIPQIHRTTSTHKGDLVFMNAVTNANHVTQEESENMKLSGPRRPYHGPKSDNKQLKLTDMLKTEGKGNRNDRYPPASQDGHCRQSDFGNATEHLRACEHTHQQETKQSFNSSSENKTETSRLSRHSDSDHHGAQSHQSEEYRFKQSSKSERFNLADKTTSIINESHKDKPSVSQAAKRNQTTQLQKTIQFLGYCNLKDKLQSDTKSIKPKTAKSENTESQEGTTEKIKEYNIVTSIPPAIAEPEIRRVTSTEFNRVVFDLETTSTGDDAEICQIAATDGSEDFNIYVVPQGSISQGASALNKLSKKRGVLFHGERRVTAVRQNDAVAQFLNWLKLKTPCVLVAHNARTFDARILVKAMTSCCEMKEFRQKVVGFSDTLTAFRERFPDRTYYSQTSLAKDLLNATYNAHNALDDVKMLQTLVTKFISDQLLLQHSFTVSWYYEYSRYLQQKNENRKTLEPLISSRAFSVHIADRAAGSGLTLNHMRFAFENGGAERLRNVLTEMVHEQKPRVTNRKKILTEICKFFQEMT